MSPLGRASGAVKNVMAPLAVWMGEKEPQAGALPQIATQSTPAFAMSFETVADTTATPPTGTCEGGVCMRDTEIVGVDDSLALGMPESVIPQPAVAIEMTSKNRTGRCAPQRSVLDAGFFPGGKEEPLPVDPDSPQNDKPHSLQRPRLIIRPCPFRNSKRRNTSGQDQRQR